MPSDRHGVYPYDEGLTSNNARRCYDDIYRFASYPA